MTGAEMMLKAFGIDPVLVEKAKVLAATVQPAEVSKAFEEARAAIPRVLECVERLEQTQQDIQVRLMRLERLFGLDAKGVGNGTGTGIGASSGAGRGR